MFFQCSNLQMLHSCRITIVSRAGIFGGLEMVSKHNETCAVKLALSLVERAFLPSLQASPTSDHW